MFQGLQGWHFIILLVIILLLFGAPKLPALARSLGQSMRIFKGEMKQAKLDDAADAAGQNPAAPNTTLPNSAVDTPAATGGTTNAAAEAPIARPSQAGAPAGDASATDPRPADPESRA